MSDTFYPSGQGNEIDWNTNIITNANLLPDLSFTAAQITAITNDCAMLIFLYTTVGELADSTYASLHGFVKSIAGTTVGTAPVDLPTLPVWAATTPAPVPAGIAARRSAWVATAKKSPNYNPETIGRTLRLEPVVTPFDPSTYVAQLVSVVCTGHETVLVKIGKGNGQVSAAQIQSRLAGSGGGVQDGGDVYGALLRRSHAAGRGGRAGNARIPAHRVEERCRHRAPEPDPDGGGELRGGPARGHRRTARSREDPRGVRERRGRGLHRGRDLGIKHCAQDGNLAVPCVAVFIRASRLHRSVP